MIEEKDTYHVGAFDEATKTYPISYDNNVIHREQLQKRPTHGLRASCVLRIREHPNAQEGNSHGSRGFRQGQDPSRERYKLPWRAVEIIELAAKIHEQQSRAVQGRY